jgi:hypothetical protein
LFVLCCKALAQSDPGPRLPCGGEASPSYPAVDSAPTVKVWEPAGLARDWEPPACAGWSEPGFSTLVATVARFHYGSGADGLLRRIGAISELTGMRYWSTTHKSWRTLILAAYALSGPAGDPRRKDFSLDEMLEGRTLYFHQEDNLFGKATYQLHILKASPDRIVFATENITTMRYLLIPLFQPGELQSLYFLDRESPEVWRYYCLARIGKHASSLTAGHQASSINRAVAFYRRLAGIPLDKEPPAAP